MPYTPAYSRKTILAAVDMLRLTHADLTRFMLELGPDFVQMAGGETMSVAKRLNGLMAVYDADPSRRLDDGEYLADVLVAKAASLMPKEPDFEWPDPPEELPHQQTFRRALERDGFSIVNRTLRENVTRRAGHRRSGG